MSEYNYESFPLDADNQDFERFPDVARAGSKAKDGRLIDVGDGSEVSLHELCAQGLTVLEFGSFT